MDRSDLELVTAIQQRGTLAGAATLLGISPPMATKRLAALEAALGQRLFLRTTRRVSPTAEGEALCAHAATLLAGFQAAEEALRDRRDEPAGPLRLVSTFGFGRLWVGPALRTLREMHPGLTVELHLTEQLPDLAADGFDGAVWLWAAPPHRSGQWVSRRLAPNQRLLVASPAYLAGRGVPRHPEELLQHDCLTVRENGMSNDLWVLQRERDGKVIRMPVRGAMSSNSGEMVRDWCLAGAGITLRSLWDVAPRLASGELVRVLPEWAMHDADIQWLAPWRARQPRRLQVLVDHLVTQFRAEPWRAAAMTGAPARPAPRRRR